ncbi:hypothetical protein [Glutamicibacter arilaitensis]|uniref:hypothetical protein n=1 Tax=Glutamicibacter arilaitensis TaxID=256701 RepID=UPI00384F5866
MGVQNATAMTLSPNMNRARANMMIDHAVGRRLEVLEGITDELLVFYVRGSPSYRERSMVAVPYADP